MLHIFHGFSPSFLPSFLPTPWLHCYLLLHWLQTMACRALWGGRPPFRAWERSSPLPPDALPLDLGWLRQWKIHHLDSKFLSPPFTNNAQPEKSERTANSNQSGASSPPTYRPGFNVAMKETFYCRLQTAVSSQLCVVYAIICEGRRGLVLIRAVKWRRSGRLLTSAEAKFIERCTKGELGGWGVTADLWSPAETQTQKGGCKKHIYFTWPVIGSKFSLGSQQMLAACKPTVGSVQASNPLDVLCACK